MATQASIDKVNLMYVAYYGRPGDPAGVNFWADVLDVNGGELTASIISAFGTSAEFTDRFGSLSDEELIDNLYLQMFNRTADAEGKAFYLEQIALGNMSLGDAALDIANGAQGSDLTILNNKINVAGYYTEQVTETGADYEADDIDAAAAILAAVTDDPITVVVQKEAVDDALANQGGVIGDTFVLTTGLDAVDGTENDDVFKGYIDNSSSDTVQGFDVLDGRGGVDTLEILVADDDADVIVGETQNIENVVFNMSGEGATNFETEVDMSLVSDVEDLQINLLVPEADGELDIDNLSAVLASGTLTLNGSDSSLADHSSDFELNVNTGDATPISIDDIHVNYLFGDYQVEVANLQNIPVLNLMDSGQVHTGSVSLELLDSTAAGTSDTLTINAHNAGSFNQADYFGPLSLWYTTDVNVDAASGDDVIEHLVINSNGTGGNGIGFWEDDALETVTVVGEANLILWFSGAEMLSSYDASAFNGEFTTSISSSVDVDVDFGNGGGWFGYYGHNGTATTDVSATLDFGSGNVWLRLSGTDANSVVNTGDGSDLVDMDTDNTDDVNLGAGNDFFDGEANLGTEDVINGGAGMDTYIADGADFTATALTGVSSFEILHADGTGTFDLSLLAGIQTINVGAINEYGIGPDVWWDPEETSDEGFHTDNGAHTFTNAEAGLTGLYLNEDFSGTVDVSLATDTTADSLMVQIGWNDADGNVDVDFTGAGVMLNDFEMLNIDSIGVVQDWDEDGTPEAGEQNSLSVLTATSLTDLTITGGSDLLISDMGGTSGDTGALMSIDASAFTGNLTLGDVTNSINGIEYQGGSGIDTFAVNDGGAVINAGAGGDVIDLDGLDTDTLADGNGVNDTLIIATGDSVVGGMDNYSNFISTEDNIDLGAYGFTGTQASALLSKGDINAAIAAWDADTEIADFFDSVGIDRAVAFSTDGTDTYVIIDDNKDGDFSSADDSVILFTGTATVALGDFGF